MPLPAPGITLAKKKAITKRLLASGATIHEINAVRKHISGIKGGLSIATIAAAVRSAAPFAANNPNTYTNTTSLTTYDSLGAAHTAQLYFIKGAVANNWTTQLMVDGNAVGTPQALTYSPTGALTAPAGGEACTALRIRLSITC